MIDTKPRDRTRIAGTMAMSEKTLPATIPALGGDASLNRYLSEIRKFPLLQPEEEYMLAKRWSEHHDTDAAAKLVTSHLRLVAKIAMGFRGYGLPVSAGVSGGNPSPLAAGEAFWASKGVRSVAF